MSEPWEDFKQSSVATSEAGPWTEFKSESTGPWEDFQATTTATTSPPQESLTADATMAAFREQSSAQMMSPRIAAPTKRDALAAEQANIASEIAPITTKVAAKVASGLEKGMAMPERAIRGGLDFLGFYSALDATLGTGTKYHDYNRGWLEHFNKREQRLTKEDADLGATGFGYDAAEGVARAATELPAQLLGGAAGAVRGAAVKGAAITAGAIGGLSQYAQDRGAGKDKTEAAIYGGVSGAITGLTTAAFGATGVESVFKSEGVMGVGGRLLNVLKQAGFEGAEESVDQFQQDLLERTARNPNKPIGESVREVLLAGSIGSLIGGAASSLAELGGGGLSPERAALAAADAPMTGAAIEGVNLPELNASLRAPPSIVEEVSLAPETDAASSQSIPSSATKETVAAEPSTNTPVSEGQSPPSPVKLGGAEAEAKGPGDLRGAGGAAVSSEFTQSPQTPTSIKNATVDVERSKRGLPPAIQPAHRSFGTVWDEAMAKIDNDPGYPDRLLTELRDRPRALNDLEDATLLHRQIDLQNEYGKATRDLAQAFDDGRMDAVANEKARVNAISDLLLDLYNINKSAGTATGRGLAARKMLAYEDFTLAKMELEKRAANDGAPLSDIQREEVIRLNKRIEDTQKSFNDYVSKTEAANAERAIKYALAEVERAAAQQPAVEPHVKIIADKIKVYFDNRADAALKRLSGKLFTISPQVLADLTDLGVSRILGGAASFTGWSAKMVEVLGDKIKPHLQTVWESSQRALTEHVEKVAGPQKEKVKRAATGATIGEQVEITKTDITEKVNAGRRSDISSLAQKLARLFVEQGIKERDPLIDAVHEALKEADTTFTRRETMDAISGYGEFKQLSKDEVSVQLRDLKGQMQQVAKIEDMQAKQAPKKTGVERRSPSDEERRLIKLVNEQKRKGGFVVTDPATQLASALQARKTYYENRISDLKSEIASRERVVKTKTPSPTDAKLESLKKEYDSLRQEHSEIFNKPGLTDAQRLDLAEKSATRQIAELERQLKTGEIFPSGKKPFVGTSPALEAAKARIEALKAEREWAREAAGPNPQPLDVEAQRRAASLDKRIADLEAQIRDEIVFPKGKTAKTETPENAAKLQEIEELKKQRQFIRERLQPKPERDVDALALKARKAFLTRKIADLRDRVARGDFTKKPKRVITPDAELNRLSFEADKAKVEWHEALMKDRLSKRSMPQKIFAGIGEVLNTSRAILTSLDLSAVLRQGGFITLAHPIRAAKSFPAMFRAFRSEAGQHAVDREIVARKNYPLYNQGKLYLSEHGQKLSQMEEAYMSRWVDKIPKLSDNMGIIGKVLLSPITLSGKLVAGSQRAYVTFLNKLRADSFDAMENSLARSEELTPIEVNAIANFINVATGRGNLGMKENALVGLNTVFFAPRYVASRFQLLAGQPLYRGSARTRVAVAKEYARYLTGVAIVYALASMDGAEIEDDPRSSDFGKLKYGNTRLDPMSGLLQNTVLLSRLGSGETKRASGEIVPIRGDEIPFGGDNSADVIARFLRSKLSPAIGAGLNFLVGKDIVGQPVTAESTAQNLLIPLALRDIYKAMLEQGIDRGTAMAILSIFGFGLQNYETNRK